METKVIRALQGFIIGGIQYPNPKVMEKYLDKLRLLYTKYPLDLIMPYANLLYSTYKSHADNDKVPRPKLLYGYIKKLRHLYQQHTNDVCVHEKLAEKLISALVISIMKFSKDLLVEFVKKDIKELYNLYKMHQGPEIKTRVKIALDCVSHCCKDSNLQEIDHELKFMKDSTSELDFSLKFNRQEFVKDKDRGEAIKELWVNLVDFEIQKLERTRLFAIVLDDDVLPKIYNVEGTFKEVLVDAHIFLEFTIKSVDSGEKSLRILLCPTRIKNDHLLRAMIEDIIDQKTDEVTELPINDATVALTNKKGISICNNPNIDISQKEILQEKEKCMVILFTGRFSILSSAYEVFVTAPEGEFKRLENCPHCLKRDWI